MELTGKLKAECSLIECRNMLEVVKEGLVDHIEGLSNEEAGLLLGHISILKNVQAQLTAIGDGLS